MAGERIFQAQDVEIKFSLRGRILTAVRGASIDLFDGETLAIVGESGCGKSVFVKSFLGVLDKNGWVSGGQILLDGVDIAKYKTEKEWLLVRGKKIAMVFQDPMTSLNPVKMVGEQIREVISWHFGTDKETAKRQAVDLLEQVGIDNPEVRYKQYPHEYSGGMRQRVVIATAIACRPKILICDEPTTALDVTVQAQILQLIKKLQKDLDMSVIYITHDLGVVANVADRVAVMYAGQIVEHGMSKEVFRDARHPYTRALLRSLPQLGVKGRELESIEGSPPNLYKEIKGDAFASRNPDALKIDYELEPPMFQVTDTHYAKTWLLHDKAREYAQKLAERQRERMGAPFPPAPGHASRETLLSVKGLTVNFKLGRKVFSAVKDISFDIRRGETFALVGESGSGKTTTGKAVVKLCHTDGGEILYKGMKINRNMNDRELTEFRRHAQMIFQDPMSSLNERAKVDYIISEGLYNFRLFKNEEERKHKIAEAMRSVGLLDEYASRFPHEFSGGQRQRIGIARSLVVEPEFIVADEPISALDVSIRAQVINLLNRLKNERGLTYLFIAHDLSVVRYIADRVAVMHKGRIVELASAEDLFARPLHPYTHALLRAVPIPDPEAEQSKQVMLYDPAMHNYVDDPPSWVEVHPGHFVWANRREAAMYRVLAAS